MASTVEVRLRETSLYLFRALEGGTLDDVLHASAKRVVAEYSSMVRRSACWAPLVMLCIPHPPPPQRSAAMLPASAAGAGGRVRNAKIKTSRESTDWNSLMWTLSYWGEGAAVRGRCTAVRQCGIRSLRLQCSTLCIGGAKPFEHTLRA